MQKHKCQALISGQPGGQKDHASSYMKQTFYHKSTTKQYSSATFSTAQLTEFHYLMTNDPKKR